MKMNNKYYATKPPGTKGGKKIPVSVGGTGVPLRIKKTPLTPRRRSAVVPAPKHIFDVTHYEDEKMVGVLMDYKVAIAIGAMLGATYGTHAPAWYTRLYQALNLAGLGDAVDECYENHVADPPHGPNFDEFLGED